MKPKERGENQRQFYPSQPPSFEPVWHPKGPSRLEPQGWTGVGFRQPSRLPFIEPLLVIIISEPLLKSRLSACLPWDQSSEWAQSLEDRGGNSHPACPSPGAAVASSGPFPESAASQHPRPLGKCGLPAPTAPALALWPSMGLVWGSRV